MAVMNEKEKNEILQKNPHLKNYLDQITKKMKEPLFYSQLPFEAREEQFPNLIYQTVFLQDVRKNGRPCCPEYRQRQPIR